MSEDSAVRRVWRFAREIAHQVHSGEDDMRAIYGDNPNHVSDGERIAAAGALGNLGSFSGGTFG